MAKKIGVSRNEMLELRKQGLSNADIANLLEISKATVFRWIGPQGCHMDSLAAFSEPKTEKVETPKEETKTHPKAVDTLKTVYEVIHSANGTFKAELDYEQELVSVGDNVYQMDTMAELATFIIGLAGRVEQRKGE